MIHLKISVNFFFQNITLIIFFFKVTQFKIAFVSNAFSLVKLKMLITFSVYSQKFNVTCMSLFYSVAIELIKMDTIYSVSYFCYRRPLHTPVYNYLDIRLLFCHMLGYNAHMCCYNSYQMFRHCILQFKKNVLVFLLTLSISHIYNNTIQMRYRLMISFKHLHTMLTVEYQYT